MKFKSDEQEFQRGQLGILDAKGYLGGLSFTLGNCIYRAIWSFAWLVFASWTPPPLHAWRRLLLRVFGAKIERAVRVYAIARIWSPANLEMGEFSCIGPRVNVYAMAKIRIGPYAGVSHGAHLCAGTHDIEDVNFRLQARQIQIGHRAWIAAEAFLGPGVIVGEGAVLGARGCSFRNLQPWMIYVGNPARPIGTRKLRFSLT